MISVFMETTVVIAVCGNSKRNHFAKPIVVGADDIDCNFEILGYHNHVYYVEMARS